VEILNILKHKLNWCKFHRFEYIFDRIQIQTEPLHLICNVIVLKWIFGFKQIFKECLCLQILNEYYFSYLPHLLKHPLKIPKCPLVM
jgi:hypothetical protein